MSGDGRGRTCEVGHVAPRDAVIVARQATFDRSRQARQVKDATGPAQPLTAALGATEGAGAIAVRDDGTGWRRKYRAAVILIDLAAAVLAVVGSFIVRFGAENSGANLVNLLVLAALPAAWLMSATFNRAYEARILGAGMAEYERLGRAFLQLTAVTTFVAWASHFDPSRGFILMALPATLVLSTAGRYAARKFLHRSRRHGRAVVRVLALGDASEVSRFREALEKNSHTGWRITAACLTSAQLGDGVPTHVDGTIPVVGDVDSVRAAVLESRASTVAVIAGNISSEKIRWISWQLEGTDADLVLLPALAEVAGRRLSIEQIGGLPLVSVAQPEFTGLRRVIKSSFDRLVATAALLLALPMLVMIGVAIRLSSRGPALFTQTRIGKDGEPFRMVKFRTMCVDAEARVAELAAHNEFTGGTMFKIRHDPRVTRIGRVLRRCSLDEVPQLLNVLTGSMSLVGPRPPLPAEVATYGGDVQRRLLVKPGMTGLWQISGRSNLSWEESVRLDLRYVEGWSLALDMVVLAKTIGAVVRGQGAY